MLAGEREILIANTPEDTPRLVMRLAGGAQWGMRLECGVREHQEWRRAENRAGGGNAFAYPVEDSERHCVVAFEESDRATGLDERPKKPASRTSSI
jgi:glucose-1-phosphate thymidylyltransferase